MEFSKQQLRKFADMVKLGMSDAELEQMNTGVVFEWLEKLRDVDTHEIEPMYSPARHNAPLRSDAVSAPNMREQILRGAPDTAGVSRGYFAVPKVMEE